MSAKSVGIAAAALLIIVLLVGSLLDPTTPPFVSALFGVVFGMLLERVLLR